MARTRSIAPPPRSSAPATGPRSERREHATPAASAVLDEGAVAQLGDGLLQLGLGVHHDRPVPGDGLLDRLARDQQETDALLARLHGDLVAAVEQHQRAV